MRPPVLPSGNPGHIWRKLPSLRRFNEAAGFTQRKPVKVNGPIKGKPQRFNEAAGFTQRKPYRQRPATDAEQPASMRPPVLPSGNHRW